MILTTFLTTILLFAFIPACGASVFSAGNLVVSVEGNGVVGATSGSYTDNQASPLTLIQYSTSGTSAVTYVNSLVLPQMGSSSNFAVSAEYGSSSEATLQLSGDGRYLTIAGYGVNAAAFNANPGVYSPSPSNAALGQSGSLTGQSYIAVPRVVALIDANGNVDSTTALYNVFNGNNPRSAYTVNGTSIYVSGQGTSGDNTGGVFLAQRGSASAVSITGNDAGSGASQDTRVVQVYNGRLYVSADSKSGSTNRDYVGTLGPAGTLPTGVANGGGGPAMLTGYGNAGGTGKLTVTAANTNGLNTVGTMVNLSPENYYFANASTLYVADSGFPKNDSTVSSGTSIANGGLQKWVNSKTDGSGTWSLLYTLSSGLNLVPNSQADIPNGNNTTGLYGLAGRVINGQVELFATNYTIGDTDFTFLYGITDSLLASAPAAGEAFVQLAAAPADSNFKGVAFAPTALSAPEPASLACVGLGLIALLSFGRRRVR